MEQESQIGRRCERAVITAYSELRQIGSDDMSAFQACTALYRIHHPEASINEARRLGGRMDRPSPGPQGAWSDRWVHLRLNRPRAMWRSPA